VISAPPICGPHLNKRVKNSKNYWLQKYPSKMNQNWLLRNMITCGVFSSLDCLINWCYFFVLIREKRLIRGVMCLCWYVTTCWYVVWFVCVDTWCDLFLLIRENRQTQNGALRAKRLFWGPRGETAAGTLQGDHLWGFFETSLAESLRFWPHLLVLQPYTLNPKP